MNDSTDRAGQTWEERYGTRNHTCLWLIVETSEGAHSILNLEDGRVTHVPKDTFTGRWTHWRRIA